MNPNLLQRITDFITDSVMPITKPDEAHDLQHHLSVYHHTVNAVNSTELEEWQRTAILTAALLHDLDDRKITKGKTPPNHWAKLCIDTVFEEDLSEEFIKCVLDIIDYVSCSKWGDTYDKDLPKWMYIVRYCDRLEAIGQIGIERCIAYAKCLNRPMHNDNTIRVRNEDELWELAATNQRYEVYCAGITNSATTIDHLYDKCLHLNLPEWMNNEYLRQEFINREQYMINYVLNYWKENL